MNKRIRKLAAVLLVLYLVLFVQLNVLQVARKEALDSHPQNNRQTIRDFNRMRGEIITADGQVLARSVPSADDDQYEYQREYPLGDLFAHITGYYTFSFGSTQLEKTQSDVLMGTTDVQKADPAAFLREDNSGTVVLTLLSDLQLVAADALGEREGSVVVMDIQTGAVLTMVSYPRYDPNLVAVRQ